MTFNLKKLVATSATAIALSILISTAVHAKQFQNLFEYARQAMGLEIKFKTVPDIILVSKETMFQLFRFGLRLNQPDLRLTPKAKQEIKEGLQGFYVQDTGLIYVLRESVIVPRDAIIIHEYVHWLQRHAFAPVALTVDEARLQGVFEEQEALAIGNRYIKEVIENGKD